MRIGIIQGHPDAEGGHYCHALAEAYRSGAEAAGHEVRSIEVAALDFSLLRTQQQFEHEPVPDGLKAAQEIVAWANHLVIVYPLWLGAMPAVLKGFFEQIFRPGFAMQSGPGMRWKKLLSGRSARVIVTMGMPASVYRWFFRAHSLKSLERNILHFVGIQPSRTTLIGMVETLSDAKRARWLERVGTLGAQGR